MRGAAAWQVSLLLALLLMPEPGLALAPLESRALAAQRQPAQVQVPAPAPQRRYDMLSPWSRMNIAPDNALPAPAEGVRPPPPAHSRRACIGIDDIGTAQLVGDSAVELTMGDGRHMLMMLAEECPGISFYQGFYYRRGRDGALCAGRDVIGARSGGECAIASIVETAPPARGRERPDDDQDGDGTGDDERDDD